MILTNKYKNYIEGRRKMSLLEEIKIVNAHLTILLWIFPIKLVRWNTKNNFKEKQFSFCYLFPFIYYYN